MDIGLFARKFIETFLLYLPAMIANATPVVIGKVIRGTHPIDMNLKLKDGRPLFGRGKTWEGFLFGLMIGALFGLVVKLVLIHYPISLLSFYVPLGALLGDILGSFIKRRLGIKRGDPLPLLDQLDFYIGSTISIIAYGKIPSLTSILLMGIIIYLLHRYTNLLAFKIGLKNVPW